MGILGVWTIARKGGLGSIKGTLPATKYVLLNDHSP